jgi:putative transposase
MCEALSVSRSGYYDWKDRPPSARATRTDKILKEIKKLHKKYPMWGLDPIWKNVNKTIKCCRNTVYKIMKDNNIKSKRKGKFKATTNSKHNLPTAPNLLKQNFDIDNPNNVWAGDITYNWTDEGWIYTAIVKDLCTKDVVGYAISNRINKELVIDAFKIALKRIHPPSGLIFHSDRGVQYCSNDFKKLLADNLVLQSMSRKGNPYDNAVAENFFSCLKCECTHSYRFKTRAEARMAIFEYIEIYYNRHRPHSSIDWMTPFEYRKMRTSNMFSYIA